MGLFRAFGEGVRGYLWAKFRGGGERNEAELREFCGIFRVQVELVSSLVSWLNERDDMWASFVRKKKETWERERKAGSTALARLARAMRSV